LGSFDTSQAVGCLRCKPADIIYSAVVNTAAALATAHTANLTVVDLVTQQANRQRCSDSVSASSDFADFSDSGIDGSAFTTEDFFLLTIMLILSSKFLTMPADYYIAILWLVLVIQQLIAIRPPSSLYFNWFLFYRNNSDSAKTGSGSATAWFILSQLKLFWAADPTLSRLDPILHI
jgi:hypothetical protein